MDTRFSTAFKSVCNKLALNYVSIISILISASVHAIYLLYVDIFLSSCSSYGLSGLINLIIWMLVGIFIACTLLYLIIKYVVRKKVSRISARILMYVSIYYVSVIVISSGLHTVHDQIDKEIEYKLDHTELLVREYYETRGGLPSSIEHFEADKINKSILGKLPFLNVRYEINTTRYIAYISILNNTKMINPREEYTPQNQRIKPGCGW